MKRKLYVGATFLIVLSALAVASLVLQKRVAVEAAGEMAPRFEVDPLWPKPLPNHWIMGQTIGVSVDAQDHVWIIHRPSTLQPNEIRALYRGAPPVLEFDPEGNLVSSWGGPGKGGQKKAGRRGPVRKGVVGSILPTPGGEAEPGGGGPRRAGS